MYDNNRNEKIAEKKNNKQREMGATVWKHGVPIA